MAIFLTITILYIMYFSYKISGRLFSPPCIACLSMGTAALVCSCNMGYWGFDISFSTILVVALGLIVFLMGYVIGRKLFKRNVIHNNEKKRFELHWIYVLIIICIGTVAVYGFYTEVNMHLWLLQATIDDDGAFARLHAAGRELFDYSWHIKYPLAFLQTITIVFIYCFIYNITRFGFRRTDLYFLSPVPYYIANSILRTDRNEILLLVLVMISLYMLMKKEITRKSVVVSICGVISFIAFFGFFRMIKTGEYDIQITVDSICVYIAGGLAAFDKLVEGNYGIESYEFGGTTFRSIYNFLKNVGFDYGDVLFSSYAGDGFVNIGTQFTTYGLGIHTNVFTAFGRIFIDFGYVGIIVYFLLYGLIVGMIEKWTLSRQEGYRYIIYAYMLYPLYIFNFDEVLMLIVLNPAMVLKWIVGYYVYRYLYIKRKYFAGGKEIVNA